MRARVPFLALLLGLSGACGLVYQIAWLREFRLVFGGATPATAAVLAIFMGGLGAGSAWFGRRVERTANPLRLYGLIEIGVGVSALLTPLLLSLVQSLYVKTGGVVALGQTAATLLQLVLAIVVLAAPCFLMGGSLPAAFKWAETDLDRQRGTLGVLYGVNTIGALAGVLASTFWLLEHLGIRATVWSAAGVNLAIGAVAWLVSRGTARHEPVKLAPPKLRAQRAFSAGGFIYIASGITGFTFFLCELVWFRMLAPLVGSSVYGFGLILALALAGIGVGGLLYRLLIARRSSSVSLGSFAVLSACQAILIGVPWALGDRIAVLAIDLSHSGAPGLMGQLQDWTMVTSVLVVGPALIAGVQFPMLVALLGEGTADAGRHTGLAYAANTVGAITGSLAGGFVLLPALTATGCWRLACFLILGMSAAAVMVAPSTTRLLKFGVTTLLAIAVALITVPEGPTPVWRHQAIGYGRVEALPKAMGDRLNRFHMVRRSVPFEFDGREASVAIAASDIGWGLSVNGKSDGSAFGDANTQVMLGVLPALLHPQPKTAFVVGLGTGSTAGWLADLPGITRVDVAELEPGMVQLARDYFAPVNRHVMDNPKVHLIVGDAREALVVNGPRYDVIASEPSNPYRAGVTTVFTREFYEAVKRRLNDGGLFAQWLQGYEVNARSVGLVQTTLATVFPFVETWATGAGDLVFIGHLAPPSYSLEQLRSRAAAPVFGEALLRGWFTRSVEGILAHHLASPEFARRVVERTPGVNTDDRNELEYGFARALAQQGNFNTGQILYPSMGMNADVPAHLAANVDLSRLQVERLLMWAAEGVRTDRVANLKNDDVRRADGIRAFIDKRYQDVAIQFAGLSTPDALEELILLESLASTGGTIEFAQPLIDAVARDWPADAHFATALMAWRKNQSDDAFGHLRDGLAALRTTVWSRRPTAESALALAVRLAHEKPGRADVLFELLREPFPGGFVELSRMNAIAAIGPRLSTAVLQVQVVEMFEPYPLWTRSFLDFRAKAYQLARDPRAAQAAADLSAFQRGRKP
jgi:spermidine synthase